MLKKILSVLMLIILTSCSVPQANNVNEDGSYVITKDGIKSDFTNKDNQKIIWYEDFTCPDCARVHNQTNDYISKLLEEDKVEIKFYPIGLLNKYLDNEYSSRSATWSLSIAQNYPEKIMEFKDKLYTEERDKNTLDDNFFREVVKEIGLSDNDLSKIEKDLEKYRKIVDESTQKAINDKDLIKLGGKEKLFVPFILIDGEVLDGESKNVKDDVIAPMDKMINDIDIGDCGSDDSEKCVPDKKTK